MKKPGIVAIGPEGPGVRSLPGPCGGLGQASR